MMTNWIDFGTELVWVSSAALVGVAAKRWPYAANAARVECIELCRKVQRDINKALETEPPDVRLMYRAFARIAFAVGEIEKKLLEVKGEER